jgi:hypothetical protein
MEILGAFLMFLVIAFTIYAFWEQAKQEREGNTETSRRTSAPGPPGEPLSERWTGSKEKVKHSMRTDRDA